jgi:hypothetical protein
VGALVRGRVRELEAQGGVTFTCRVVLELPGGGSRVLRFVATAPDARLAPGNLLEARLVENPVAEEVVFCRNLTTGQVLVDRIHHQAGRMARVFLVACLAVAAMAWALWTSRRL